MTENENLENRILEIVKWWERKRLIYSLILILVFVLGFFLRTEIIDGHRILSAILISAIWLVGANAFYCAGWGFEILFIYYFEKRGYDTENLMRFCNKNRMIFFVLGTILSIIWTWINLVW